jgi:hypothetical protein
MLLFLATFCIDALFFLLNHISLAHSILKLFPSNFYLLRVVSSNYMSTTYPFTTYFLYFSCFSHFVSFFSYFIFYIHYVQLNFSVLQLLKGYWVDCPYTFPVNCHSPIILSLYLLDHITVQHLHL